MASFEEVISIARESYNSSYCTVDNKWRLQQLHSLHGLVLDNRDALVSALAAKQATHTWIYEREIGVLVKDLHSHITSLERPRSESSVRERPVGIAVIVCNDLNPLRYGLASLAAAIAAGNIVVLATTVSLDDPFMSCLRRLWRKYMDTETVFFVPGVELASLDDKNIDHISIFGTAQPHTKKCLYRFLTIRSRFKSISIFHSTTTTESPLPLRFSWV